MKISVAIPAFASESYRGDLYLKELIESIMGQTYTNYELLISDHSESDRVFNIVKEYIDKVDIKYFRNKINRGNISANTNNAILKSSGDIIKVMHVDDVICNKNLFQQIIEGFKQNPEKKWGACGFNHNYVLEGGVRREMIPDVNGVVGNPSVSFFINDGENTMLYDENLRLILDSDFHDRLLKEYGSPIIIQEMSVTVRMHKSQASNYLESFHQEDIKKKRERDENKMKIKVENDNSRKHIIIGETILTKSGMVNQLIENDNNVLMIYDFSVENKQNINPKFNFFKLNFFDKENIKCLEKFINKDDIIYISKNIQNDINEYSENNLNKTSNFLLDILKKKFNGQNYVIDEIYDCTDEKKYIGKILKPIK